MNPENTEKLLKHGLCKPERPPNEGLMCFGFECGDGWFEVLDRLFRKLVSFEGSEDFEVLQVKEKFGGLRVYGMGFTDEAYDLIEEAEFESEETCEVCGNPGEVRNRGSWLLTRCDECWKMEEPQT